MSIQHKKIMKSVATLVAIMTIGVLIAPWLIGGDDFESRVIVFSILGMTILLTFFYEIARRKITLTRQQGYFVNRIAAVCSGLVAVSLGVGVNMSEHPLNFKVIVSIAMGIVVLFVLRTLYFKP